MMKVEIRRSRYLEHREQTYRAGMRLIVAAALLLGSTCASGLATFAIGMDGLGNRFPDTAFDEAARQAAIMPSWLLIIAALVLAVAFVAQRRWLWPAYGAWISALSLTAVTVWLFCLPENGGFAALFTLASTAFGAAVHWALRHFGPPPA